MLVYVLFDYCRNIKRIIFYSLIKPTINEKGEKEMNVIAPATALQIAGRAGRYASQFIEGEVTTFSANDLPLLQKLLNTPVEPILVCYMPYCKALVNLRHELVVRLLDCNGV